MYVTKTAILHYAIREAIQLPLKAKPTKNAFSLPLHIYVTFNSILRYTSNPQNLEDLNEACKAFGFEVKLKWLAALAGDLRTEFQMKIPKHIPDRTRLAYPESYFLRTQRLAQKVTATPSTPAQVLQFNRT